MLQLTSEPLSALKRMKGPEFGWLEKGSDTRDHGKGNHSQVYNVLPSELLNDAKLGVSQLRGNVWIQEQSSVLANEWRIISGSRSIETARLADPHPP
jgi:hypothetical protein